MAWGVEPETQPGLREPSHRFCEPFVPLQAVLFCFQTDEFPCSRVLPDSQENPGPKGSCEEPGPHSGATSCCDPGHHVTGTDVAGWVLDLLLYALLLFPSGTRLLTSNPEGAVAEMEGEENLRGDTVPLGSVHG